MDVHTILNILTGLLAVATVWLAVATHLMARATKRAVELEATPYLSFAEPRVVVGRTPSTVPEAERKSSIRLGIALRNPGKIRVQYQVRTLRMTFNSLTVENPVFNTTGSYVFPGETSVYWYGTLQVAGDVKPPNYGTAEFEVAYWAANERDKATLSQSVTYSLLSFEPPYLEWVNTREVHGT
jgi:hypothetical protein